ncbi:MAG: tRNA (adenosine(37)-N6)-threonylcarbamoyltransferase complex ATPase subunit type 1 TsaE [Lachnospiraceae bacterium]|jgi:tRNA threonylcarbamoyladenosine biosynthesis protein TsaE|nr:tRNA (adenosine(37)-N6)-threonylcarbamoyltransferase complex ATPase subunit type 1 TsaE [Lachnospiraceae bacterium]
MAERIYETASEAETFNLAKRMGETAKAGEVYALDGDLGAGKTVFAKGFAAGLGVAGPVTSPTFTIVKEYGGGRLALYHFDLYRVSATQDPRASAIGSESLGLMDSSQGPSDAAEEALEDLGYEEYFYGDGVTLVEWAGLAPWLIPGDAVHVRIERDSTRGDGYRSITVKRKNDGEFPSDGGAYG